MSSSTTTTAKEQQEQEDETNRIIALSYTKDQLDELKRHTRQHTIKAYSLFYVAKNSDDDNPPPPERNLNYSSYWCLKLYQLTLVSLKKPSDGDYYLALPTALDQTTVRLPAEYGDKPTEKLIEKQTGGDTPAGAAIVDDEEFNYDSDLYASKLKKQAEQEGYQKLTYYPGIATWGGAVFPALFNFGINNDKDLMERFGQREEDESSTTMVVDLSDDSSSSSTQQEQLLLYQDIAVNRLFSKAYPVESDPETGAESQRAYYHFVPKSGGISQLPEGLIPDHMAQEGTRMLRELRAKVQDKKRTIAQETALLKSEKPPCQLHSKR